MLARQTADAQLGIDRFGVRNQVAAGRWAERSDLVISTTTGALTREQWWWLGILHAGPRAILGGLTAAEATGLRNWQRDEVTVLIPQQLEVGRPRRHHPIDARGATWTTCDPRRVGSPDAGSSQPSCSSGPIRGLNAPRRASVAACVQQRLTTPEAFQFWLSELRPLALGSDVPNPARRHRRRIAVHGRDRPGPACAVDAASRHPTASPSVVTRPGRIRFTDAEWRLPNGSCRGPRGGRRFPPRRRALGGRPGPPATPERSRPDHRPLHGATRLRDEPELVVADLIALGVPVVSPRSAPWRTLRGTTRAQDSRTTTAEAMPASWERERWIGRDAHVVGAGEDGGAQGEHRAAGGLRLHLGVVPGQSGGRLERLDQRLLGREPGGQRRRAAGRPRPG